MFGKNQFNSLIKRVYEITSKFPDNEKIRTYKSNAEVRCLYTIKYRRGCWEKLKKGIQIILIYLPWIHIRAGDTAYHFDRIKLPKG